VGRKTVPRAVASLETRANSAGSELAAERLRVVEAAACHADAVSRHQSVAALVEGPAVLGIGVVSCGSAYEGCWRGRGRGGADGVGAVPPGTRVCRVEVSVVGAAAAQDVEAVVTAVEAVAVQRVGEEPRCRALEG
jgi:hypothetical protein